MKKSKLITLFAFIALMFSTTIQTQAQIEDNVLKRGEFGIRYMPTFTKLDVRDSKGNVIPGSVSIRQGAGIMLGFNFNTHFGIMGELDYSTISQRYKDQDLNREVNIRYINIPVMFAFNTSKSSQFNLNVVAGPNFGLNAGSDVSTDGGAGSDTLTAVVVLKKGAVGFAYGAGFEFAVNKSNSLRFDIGIRGFYSFVDITIPDIVDDRFNAVAKVPRNVIGAYAGLTVQF